MDRVLPQPTPETQHFWDGCKAGELRLQRCTDCKAAYFPPRPFCPKCASRDVEEFKASGRGFLYGYNQLWDLRAPALNALVDLEEGVRIMTNIVGCPQTPEALKLDMPVEVTFTKFSDEISLPFFQPAGA